MNLAPLEPQRWPWGRWSVCVLLVAVLQVGLICWLEDHRPSAVRPVGVAPTLQLAAASTNELLALNDPTLFALPHRQSFAGLAWLAEPPQQYHAFTWTEEPRWLALPVNQLGEAFYGFTKTNTARTLDAVPQPAPELSQPAVPATEEPWTHSSLQVFGDLALRKLLATPTLPAWTNTDLLTNSVVQLMVDARGWPVAAALLVSSGAKEADQHALSVARAARFEPLAGASERPAPGLDHLSWGELVFQWQTLPAAISNP